MFHSKVLNDALVAILGKAGRVKPRENASNFEDLLKKEDLQRECSRFFVYGEVL